MKKLVMAVVLALFLTPAGSVGGEEAAEVIGTVKTARGDVQVGRDGAWRKAVPGDELLDGESVKTGPGSTAEILFGEELTALVGEGEEIALADLQLKTRLEAMKSKITKPADSKRVEIQVTPTTGVRGTEQTEKKAEELKREHYWTDKPSP